MINFASPVWAGLLVVPFIFYYIMPAVKGLHGDALRVPFLANLKRIAISSGSLWQAGNVGRRADSGSDGGRSGL